MVAPQLDHVSRSHAICTSVIYAILSQPKNQSLARICNETLMVVRAEVMVMVRAMVRKKERAEVRTEVRTEVRAKVSQPLPR